MSFISDIITESWADYSRFLQDGGDRQKHSPGVRGHLELVHASQLGYCEIKSALEQNEVESDFPELEPRNNPNLLWLFENGTRQAEKLQEAMKWKYPRNFIAEKHYFSIEDDLAGNSDGTYTDPYGNKYIIELKDTEGMIHRSVGEPKRGYVLQTLAYMFLAQAAFGVIVTMSRWKFTIYDMVEEENGWVVYNQGRKYTPIGEDWNTGITLQDLWEARNVVRAARDAVEDDRHHFDGAAPFDPISGAMAFLCTRKIYLPTKGGPRSEKKDGLHIANCPWAGRCQALTRNIATTLEDGVLKIKGQQNER